MLHRDDIRGKLADVQQRHVVIVRYAKNGWVSLVEPHDVSPDTLVDTSGCPLLVG